MLPLARGPAVAVGVSPGHMRQRANADSPDYLSVGAEGQSLRPVRVMSPQRRPHTVAGVNHKPPWGAETATQIGLPRRIYVVEPLENPVPAKRTPPAPKEPADPRPKRVREPKVPAA